MLLDEPFSALDAHLRFRLERELAQVMKDFGKTVLLVSHDRDEVYRLSDRVLILHNGGVEVCDTRDAVFRDPRTRQAALLTGCKNLAPCRMLSPTRMHIPQWGLTLDTGPLDRNPDYAGIRMHHIGFGEGENTLTCQVVSELENPFSFVVMLKPLEAPDAAPIGWELDKTLWQRIRRDTLTIHIPKSAILPCVETINTETRNRL